MSVVPSRRHVLRLIAGGVPLLASGARAVPAAKTPTKTATVERLIRESRSLSHVGERIDFISGKLLGIRYQGDTLIGSPKQPEQFVVRDDAFDCVTFCETALAAAISRDLAEFEINLRRIRYDGGVVQYDKRNHYFADWCARNILNGICQPVPIEPSVKIDKVLTWHREFGRHPVSITAVDKATMIENQNLLASGDIIGILSRRAGLDFYHTGLIAFGKNGDLLLRSAALSKGRALDQKMTDFIAAYPVKYVALLRAAESQPMVERR